MSITHILKFESTHSQDEILNLLLVSNLGLYPANYDQMKGEGIFGRVSENSLVSQQHFFEDYGFKPNLRVSFDEDSDGNVEEGEKIIGKAVAQILQKEGNAIFFYVVDTPILKKLSGRIQVAEDVHFNWLRNSLSLMNLKYEIVPKSTLSR